MNKLLYFIVLSVAITCMSCKGDGKEPTPSEPVNDTLTEAKASEDSLRELKSFQAKAAGFISDFYEEFVLGEDEVTPHVAESYFTPSLEQKLSSLYDYDNSEGYAIWEFRTGAQDGPSRVSKVVSVQPLSRTEYRVDFIDMGISGQKIITIADSFNQFLIDNYEDVVAKK